MADILTDRQQKILEFIRDEAERRGMPPTVREIANRFGMASPNGVLCHLRALEAKGCIVREPGAARGIRTVRGPAGFPLVGRVAAGAPVLAAQEYGETMTPDEAVGARPGDFFLRVKGDSMSGAGINSGDIAVVRPGGEPRDGEIVVAMVGEEEATLKKFHREKGGRVKLAPENPAYEPIIINPKETRVTIVGSVVGILRKY